jgi:hypothetical protein
MFHVPPQITTNAEHSYFQASLHLHHVIRKDLNDILSEDIAPSNGETTIEQVHASLQKLEKQLFGSESQFDVNIKGCCLYTRSLEGRLTTTSGCHLV